MPDSFDRRPTPEQLLQQVEAEERAARRGALKVFLGYASGVGKTHRMLDEGRRRKQRGEDVVIAALQSESPHDTRELAAHFESIPLDESLGAPAIDVAAVLRRRPQLCLIDGLAYANPPGSRHAYRWQDVRELLDAGIGVITSINLQFVAERQQQVEAIRGKRVADSVPEAFLHTADEIEIVDAPPEYCVTRLAMISGAKPADAAYLERQLSELREIALLLAAEVVDTQLADYLQRQGSAQLYATHERILVCVTPRSNASVMIHRGRRQADRFHGELHVVYVEQEGLNERDRATLDGNLKAAREAQAHVEVLQGEDAADAILHYAERHAITQIFVGHSPRRTWVGRLRASFVERLIVGATGIDVRIFPQGPGGTL